MEANAFIDDELEDWFEDCEPVTNSAVQNEAAKLDDDSTEEPRTKMVGGDL